MASNPQTTATISTAMSASFAFLPSLPPVVTTASPADDLVPEVADPDAAAAVFDAAPPVVLDGVDPVEEGRVVTSGG